MMHARLSVWLLAASLASGCAAVPPQHVGVLETFGKVSEVTWPPGLHAWAPWFGVHRINCQTLQIEEKTTTPTGEGLLVGLDVSLVYHTLVNLRRTPSERLARGLRRGSVRAL